MVYCKICQKELHESAEMCPDCGVRNARSAEKIPELSIILSLIIPGLGQSYNGQGIKSLVFFCIGILIFLSTIVYKAKFLSMVDGFLSSIDGSTISNIIELIYPIFVVLNVFDAYRTAQNINANI